MCAFQSTNSPSAGMNDLLHMRRSYIILAWIPNPEKDWAKMPVPAREFAGAYSPALGDLQIVYASIGGFNLVLNCSRS